MKHKILLKNVAISILAVFTGFSSIYIPLTVHSINLKDAVLQAFNESLDLSHALIASVAGSTKSTLKKGALNIFTLEPLQYLQVQAPIFNLLSPVSGPTPTKVPRQSSNNTGSGKLQESLNETSAPTITKRESKPEESLVNIFCSQKIVLNGKVTNQRRIITGSGILIHKDGTILTNAHVAQFPLLSETDPNIVCIGRYGNPASGAIGIKTVFISPQWVKEYGKYINTEGAAQTGSSDFALLKLNLDNLSQTQRNLLSPVTVQKTLPNQGEIIYSLSYPANILGVRGVNSALPQQKESLQINRMYSLGVTPIDIIETTASTAGQRGSSGGAILDIHGHLIGTIATVVNSSTPSKTLIRAITMEHVDFELTKFSNVNLAKVIQYGGIEATQVFNTKYREYLTSLLNNYLNSL